MPDVRVLLVEHDAVMRRATARVLRDHFAVTQAHDAVRALELILVDDGFDVIVTSVASPKMDGLALLDRLRAEHHGLGHRCLVLADDADALRPRLRGRPCEVLAQPARIRDIVAAVQRAADRAA